ncbi:MAG TPA: thiamine pyrophosphate-binding protein, partial [Dehalococcoidia bacterium]|nr:thiamine pyrophosphate-binding protein [Dehalococcoidia bacterium]
MTEMTGGQALMKSLYREGIRVIFGLPGVQLYHAMDALYDEPGIRFITTRHEQATAYMADGFSRAGGGIGTALMVPGPGLLNAAAAIGTAYSASSPILVLSGQIERDLIGVNRGMLHEVDDQIDCIKPITKWAKRILDPAEVPEAVHEAFFNLKTGRPRPVEIEIPPETLAEVGNVELLEPEEYPRPVGSAQQLQQAAQVLSQATAPLIWAGGG